MTDSSLPNPYSASSLTVSTGTHLGRWLVRVEYWFNVLSLLLYSSDLIGLLISGGASEGDGTDIFALDYSLNRQVFFLNYLLTFILVALRWKKVLNTLCQNIYLLALIALVILSFLWSAAPGQTLSGLIGMLATTLYGVYLASRYSMREQLALLGTTFSISIILSFVFALLLPGYGIMGGTHAGTWRGIYTHKNQLGKRMVLSALVFLIQAQLHRSWRWSAWLGYSLSVALIVLSTSVSALLNVFLITLAVFGSRLIGFRRIGWVLWLGLGAACTWAFWTLLPDIAASVLEPFGRDTSLTGRTDIWPYILEKVQQRPWLGYGYSAFWGGLTQESADIIRAVRWPVPDSHNGYLDLVLQVGIVGFGLYLLGFWDTLTRSVLLIRATHRWEQTWVFAFLIFTVLINIGESSLLSRNSVFWVLYVTTMCSETYEFRRIFQGYVPNNGGSVSANGQQAQVPGQLGPQKQFNKNHDEI